MFIDVLRTYCLAKPGVTESFPFDDNVLVFKVGGKMFLATGLSTWDEGQGRINVKCDPEIAVALRREYDGVEPGYHMNKRHWNTIWVEGDLAVPEEQVMEWIDHSYDLVFKKLPKRLRQDIFSS